MVAIGGLRAHRSGPVHLLTIDIRMPGMAFMRRHQIISVKQHTPIQISGAATTSRHGWTLSELLVVIAMIALLLCILLHSLSKARAQAKAAVCASNLAQLCRAENLYQTESNGWIPGSPWTTGKCFLDLPDATWNPARRFNRLAIEWMDYATSLKALMHGPDCIPRPADKKAESAQSARMMIIERLTQDLFRCPANPHVATKGHGPSDGPTIPAVSYMTIWTLMRAGPATLKEVLEDKDRGYKRWPGMAQISPDPDNPNPEDRPYYVAQSPNWDVVAPDAYMPRHNRLGREQIKVFLADGLRFYDPDENTITYTTHPRAAKGMVSASPPSTAEDGDPTDQEGREYNAARQFSYRHGNNDHINAGFFDGHVESLGVEYRRAISTGRGFSGNATNPQWYYPSGSVVNDPSGLHRNTIAQGTRLP